MRTSEPTERSAGASGSTPFILLSTGAVLYAAVFLYFVSASVVWAPVYDYLDWIAAYLDALQTGQWRQYFWLPHNEHRILLSRILVALDVRLFGASHVGFIASGITLLFCLLASLFRVIAISGLNARTAIAGSCAVIFLILPSTIATLCSMPANQVFLHQTAFAVFAFILANRPGMKACVLAMGSAVVAAMGGAGGILVWPVLALTAFLTHKSGRLLAVYSICGTAFVTVYLAGIPRTSVPHDLSGVIAAADYFIRFFGLPWAHVASLTWVARSIGITLVITGSVLLVTNGSGPPAVARIGRCLIIFAFLLGGAAAVARFSVATDRAMPIRYALFVSLLHVGIVLVLLPRLDSLIQRVRGRGPSIAVALLLALALTQQVLVGQAAVAETAKYNAAWSRFAEGHWDTDMTHYVYADKTRAETNLKAIQASKLYRSR
jgi:hypothetical protein